MSENIIDRLLAMASTKRTLLRGAQLFATGDDVDWLYVVVSGEIQLVRYRETGHQAILQRAGPGQILAEASLLSDCYHCHAVAMTDAVVAPVSRQWLRSQIAADPDLAALWMKHLGREVQKARTRGEILSRRTVREKLDAWLAENGGALPHKGIWRHLADEIAVSPEALYREIARRR
jgi:CRP/FNR family transcriptional regulator, dissimilatory nitrate respiration regulator